MTCRDIVCVCVCVCVCARACVRACSVVSNSLWPHGLKPAGLLYPWNFPGKNTWCAETLRLLKWSLMLEGDEAYRQNTALGIQVNVKLSRFSKNSDYKIHGVTWLLLIALECVYVENEWLKPKNIWHGRLVSLKEILKESLISYAQRVRTKSRVQFWGFHNSNKFSSQLGLLCL